MKPWVGFGVMALCAAFGLAAAHAGQVDQGVNARAQAADRASQPASKVAGEKRPWLSTATQAKVRPPLVLPANAASTHRSAAAVKPAAAAVTMCDGSSL